MTRAASHLQPHPEPSVVDLAIFYDQAHAQRGVSLRALDDTARTMIDFMNASLGASGIPLTIRQVYAGPFDRSVAGLSTHAAHSLLGERARALRTSLLDDYGADAVVLIRATDDADEFFGVATLGSEGAFQSTDYVPYAVVCLGAAPNSGLECFGRGGIFAHEVGHMLGAGHQVGGPGGSAGAFEYSHASDCGGGTLVFSPVSSGTIYSTPTITIGGQVCGAPPSAGPDGADNAHTIDLLREPMARLRQTMPVAGTVRITDTIPRQMREGDAPLTITVQRDGDLSGDARVFLDVIAPAVSANDLTIQPGELIFTPGQSTLTTEVRVVDDGTVEPVESFELALRNPWRLERDPATLQITVDDNDVTPAPPPPAPPSPGGGGIAWLLLWLAGLGALLRARACGHAR